LEGVKGLAELTKLKAYIQLLRPKHWIKNLFVFAALLFSRNIDKLPSLAEAAWAFLCFCLTASAVYIFNDLIDMEKDRKHPRKCRRPLASGRIGRGEAILLLAAMLPAVVILPFLSSFSFGLVILIYLLNNLLYTVYLKNVVILDVMSIAAGFILRVAGGAIAIAVQISPWLILCTFLLALFLGFSKRRNELLVLEQDAQDHRLILGQYSLEFIDNMLSIVTASTLISYSMYTFFASDEKYSMVTILFVLYGIFRYQYIIYNKKQGESPEEIVLSDKPMLINIILWILVSTAILYI
jgi:4-hydroxybenzoate polyprenyltransferase